MGNYLTILNINWQTITSTDWGIAMTEEPTSTFAPAILSAWQAELKATRNPIVKEQCLQQAPDLLPRFTEHYQQLKTLRRSVRRGLQR